MLRCLFRQMSVPTIRVAEGKKTNENKTSILDMKKCKFEPISFDNNPSLVLRLKYFETHSQKLMKIAVDIIITGRNLDV